MVCASGGHLTNHPLREGGEVTCATGTRANQTYGDIMAADSALRGGTDAAFSTAALAALNVAEREVCGNSCVDEVVMKRVTRAVARAREMWGDLSPELKKVLLLRLLAVVPAARAAASLMPVHSDKFALDLATLCEQNGMCAIDDAELVAKACALYHGQKE